MANKRQRLARKKFWASQGQADGDGDGDRQKADMESRKRRGGGDGGDKKAKKPKKLGKHPLRIPGMKPGDGCFICHSKDHIAKNCPTKNAKKICLLCREHGHTLKYCPDGQKGQEIKYCYNCGETGHRLSECPKPIQNGGTAFAECFLCKEHGHLSKNCPRNTHGIYPRGGSCKVCGGLTHLAKDCPEKHTKKPAGGQSHTKLQILREPATAAKPGEQGHRIVFRSGDDLEDDFISTDAKTETNGNSSLSPKDGEVSNLSAKVDMMSSKQRDGKKRAKVIAKSDKNITIKRSIRTPKIVNFLH